MSEKASLPKGMRDFGPAQMAKRNFIIGHIRHVFQLFGFQPLETPAMENLETLTGKYGEEGDQLLFKVLDSGDYLTSLKEYISFDQTAQGQVFDFFEHLSHDLFCKHQNSHETREQLSVWVHELHSLHLQNIQGEKLKRAVIDFLNHQKDYIADVLSQWLFQRNRNPEFVGADDIQKLVNEMAKSHSDRQLDGSNIRSVTRAISEKGLRYDLTVPFARYVVMNRHNIAMPFKRYQIQPVWRADRPQKGRYREFYQCDADVVGTDSLLCEAEIILMITEVFARLGINDYTIKINHRGILSGVAELANGSNEMALFVAIDKLDKVGEEKVREELRNKGFDEAGLDVVFSLLNQPGSASEKINFLTEKFANSPRGQKGTAEVQTVLQLLHNFGGSSKNVELDVSLARGLSYYTGCIFEVKINNVAIGSVSGGGRYDNLTQAFGAKEKLSGVGISFGIDRLYDAMDELKLFSEASAQSTKVLICWFDETSRNFSLRVVQQLRSNGIAAEIYPDAVKIQKQLDYANKKNMPFVVLIGSDEVASASVTLKNMQTGQQQKVGVEQLAAKIR